MIAGCITMYHEHTDLISSLLLMMQYIFIIRILHTTSVYVIIFL